MGGQGESTMFISVDEARAGFPSPRENKDASSEVKGTELTTNKRLKINTRHLTNPMPPFIMSALPK
jgi:hypothetical protein